MVPADSRAQAILKIWHRNWFATSPNLYIFSFISILFKKLFKTRRFEEKANSVRCSKYHRGTIKNCSLMIAWLSKNIQELYFNNSHSQIIIFALAKVFWGLKKPHRGLKKIWIVFAVVNGACTVHNFSTKSMWIWDKLDQEVLVISLFYIEWSKYHAIRPGLGAQLQVTWPLT